jgi:hypothetical protein
VHIGHVRAKILDSHQWLLVLAICINGACELALVVDLVLAMVAQLLGGSVYCLVDAACETTSLVEIVVLLDVCSQVPAGSLSEARYEQLLQLCSTNFFFVNGCCDVFRCAIYFMDAKMSKVLCWNVQSMTVESFWRKSSELRPDRAMLFGLDILLPLLWNLLLEIGSPC